jgi:hypothetical protein
LYADDELVQLAVGERVEIGRTQCFDPAGDEADRRLHACMLANMSSRHNAHVEHVPDEWASGKRTSGRVLIVAEVVESQAHLADVSAVLGADDSLIVALHANLATLRERVIAREPDGWFGLEHLLDDVRRLHAIVPSLDGLHLVIDTEQLTIRQFTETIRAARPDVLTATTT